MRNVQSKPGIASRMTLGALVLVALAGITVAAHAETDLSQGGSDTKVESGEKTVKCCPIVVPRERSCRSPLKPVSSVQKKSWDGSWNYWRKAKAEAKARAMAEARARAQAAAKAKAKVKAEARAKEDAKAKEEAKVKEQDRAKVDAKAKEEAKVEEQARAKVDAKAKEEAKVEEQARARVDAEALGR
ncbi:MAG: hypothetical protein ACYTE3_02865 [Planctomycetota bacterium]